MSSPGALLEKPQILIADGDDGLRAMARDAFEGAGYQVVELGDGREVLERYERRPPSLAVLAGDLPVKSGFDVCRELRHLYPFDVTPVLLLTDGDRESIHRAYDAGATDFVSRPINWTVLGHRVRYLLRAGRALADLRQSQISLANAQRIARLGSWEWDPETGEMRWSDELFRILVCDPDRVRPDLGCFLERVHPEDRKRVQNELRQAVRLGKPFRVEHRVRVEEDAVIHAELQGEVAAEARNRHSWLRGTLQDVTSQRQAQERIRYLADYDSLTGLANRRLFHERLERAVKRSRDESTALALLYLDLDGFKKVNDNFGHGAGDLMLEVVADRLRNNLRAADVVSRPEGLAPTSEVSRLGGDEFAVLLPRVPNPEDAGDVARRVLRLLAQPIDIEGIEIAPTVSIGIALFPHDADDPGTLVRNADRAMYHAKETGRNNYQFFSASLNAASLRRLTLESRLKEAIEREELCLHYQPRVDLQTGQVIGMEALLRWSHPDLGVVSPTEFVPLSEETGLIHPIGEWVMRTACAQNLAWQEAGYEPVRVSVNVSAKQLLRDDVDELVMRALRETGLDPNHLEIELTESAVVEDDERTTVALRQLRRMGVKVALDDFGTGYSSLAYLSRFPFDTLKLDRCFVRDLATDASAAGIASAVIALAHGLGVRVVAEGVDAEDQRVYLRDQGCDELQGFLFSRPVPPAEFERFLVRRRGPAEIELTDVVPPPSLADRGPRRR